MHNDYDAIIVGSGAGGAAAAYHLTQLEARVLVLEKGEVLPRDGSTLDAETVLRRGMFLNTEPWLDREGHHVTPEEHFNLGGKTKWYGAALLRFSPSEFDADPARHFLPWPIRYQDLVPFYDEAERLLGVRQISPEPDLRHIVAGLKKRDARWTEAPLAVGLAPEIASHPEEARHFDGFASARGLKADAETAFLDRIRNHDNVTILTGKAVARLLPVPRRANQAVGVQCSDGSVYLGRRVVLAAGALHSPRLLGSYLEATRLAEILPCYRQVGRNYKSHVLTAMIAFSPRKVRDLLGKTLLLLHEAYPASSVQALGGNLAEEIVRGQIPRLVPKFAAGVAARRAYGFFLQTEDGSHPDNRVRTHFNGGSEPMLDQTFERVPEALAEHRALTRALRNALLSLGYLPFARPVPITGTAHACGTLVAGSDPENSVVDGEGRVHGLANVFVADGSVLPRSSRVNPALTIYAWGLRVASRMMDLEDLRHAA